MTTIDIFYQGHGIAEFEHVELRNNQTVAEFKAIITEKHGLGGELLAFIEGQEEPIAEDAIIGEVCFGPSAKLHIHPCRKVHVEVTFAGETVHHPFGPATTVGAVKNWAAIDKFGMSEAEAGEHLLQIAGTKDRPTAGTHIGSLTTAPECRVKFDLVPDERVNGAPEASL